MAIHITTDIIMDIHITTDIIMDIHINTINLNNKKT